MVIRTFFAAAGVAATLLLTGCKTQQAVTISQVQTFQPNWTASPGEAQSTVIRYAQPDGTNLARILISNDFVPDGQVFVPTGTVAYQDINGQPQLSTFDVPPGCSVPFSSSNRTCDWMWVSNDHDLISTPDGTVYLMAGVGYKGPTVAATQPNWFLGGPNWNTSATYRGDFGPNTRGSVAVWKSTDHGQSFHWSNYFDPTAYFNGSCAFPQFQNTSIPYDPTAYQGAQPWDMGGSDGQAAWVDSMTGKIFLTFQCVGYLPTKVAPWTLTTLPSGQLASDGSNRASTPVGVTLLASFDGNNWNTFSMAPTRGWRMGAIPYNQFLLLGVGSNLMIADTTKQNGNLQAAYPTQNVTLPQVPSSWPNFTKPSFYAVAVPDPNVLTRWGYDGYAFGYATNNAATGAAPVYGYSVYYFSLPAQVVSSQEPSPTWAQLPSQINPTQPGGFITDPTAIDVGSGTTLLYWYDVDVTDQNVTMRGRLLMEGGVASDDFAITPAPFPVGLQAGQSPRFWGDYKTAGGYCWNDGQSVTSVYHPMWVDVLTGTAQYAEISTKVPWTGTTPIAPACRQYAATNLIGGTVNRDRSAPRKVPLQMTKPLAVAPGRLVNGATVKVRVPPPDVGDHEDRPTKKPLVSNPKRQ